MILISLKFNVVKTFGINTEINTGIKAGKAG
jgi:hypothetical protein